VCHGAGQKCPRPSRAVPAILSQFGRRASYFPVPQGEHLPPNGPQSRLTRPSFVGRDTLLRQSFRLRQKASGFAKATPDRLPDKSEDGQRELAGGGWDDFRPTQDDGPAFAIVPR